MVCAFLPSDPLSKPSIPSLRELLDGASLSHLHTSLQDKTIDELSAVLRDKGRPAFLRYLRDDGVAKLADRQNLANALGRLLREVARHVPATGVDIPADRPDLESPADLLAMTTWVPFGRGRAAEPDSQARGDEWTAARSAMQPWLRAYFDESLSEDDCVRALRLAEAQVLSDAGGDAESRDAEDVAHFRQAMERQSGAALTLMMEYKTEAATQSMLAAGARGISVCLEAEKRTVKVWVYRLM